MCLICLDLSKNKLKSREALQNFSEMKGSMSIEHQAEVSELITKKQTDELIEEFVKSFKEQLEKVLRASLPPPEEVEELIFDGGESFDPWAGYAEGGAMFWRPYMPMVITTAGDDTTYEFIDDELVEKKK